MKLYRYLLLTLLLAISFKGSVAQDDENQSQSLLLKCPDDTLVIISSYLDPQWNLNFRETCKATYKCVDDFYQYSLEEEFNNFLEQDNKIAPSLPLNYLHKLLANILEKDGYLFIPQGSELEKYFYEHYSRISLYPFLQKDMAWTQELFQTLFGRQMPHEEKMNLALKLLSACLPLTHIYSTQEADSFEIVNRFKKNHHEALQNALSEMNKQHSYYLIGIDEDRERLATRSHFIVATQSDQSDLQTLDEEGYLPENNPHTLIYNVDQNVLTSPRLPRYISKLIFTNGDNQCTSIEDSFSPEGCIGLKSIELSAFPNLGSIGNDFLMTNFFLTSLKFGSLPNLRSIGNNFLGQCYALTTVELGTLPNLISIGDSFLFKCDRLSSIKWGEFKNLAFIGKRFLFGCDGLTFVKLGGLWKVTSIGDNFLSWCEGLTSLNLDGLSHLTSIGVDFLWSCNNLTFVDLSRISNAAYTLILNNRGFHSLGLIPQDETDMPQIWTKHKDQIEVSR